MGVSEKKLVQRQQEAACGGDLELLHCMEELGGVSERTYVPPARLWPGQQGSLTSRLTSNDRNTHEVVIKAVEVRHSLHLASSSPR